MSHRLRLIWLILLLTTSITLHAQETESPPPPFGVLRQTDAVSDGYVLFSPVATDTAYLIDNEGRLIHQWQAETRIFNAYLLDNGDLLASTVHLREQPFPSGTTGRIVRITWEGDIVWSYEIPDPQRQLHHDIDVLPDGNILMNAWERVPPEEFAAYGIDPNLTQENEGVFFDVIIEVDPSTNEIVWEWRVLENSIQSRDESLLNYGFPAANPHLINLNYRMENNPSTDLTHINSVDYNPDRDEILVSVHYHDEIWIIDRATGDLVYRWGNPAAYERGLLTNRQLFKQHNATWLDDGNILVFSNGMRGNFNSTVVEITPPYTDNGSYYLVDGAAFGPVEPAWRYDPEGEDDFYARNLSGAQRLPNGNTFITDGPNGRLFEINPAQEIVWEYKTPFWREGQDALVPISNFRATRYLPDHPALRDRDLTPQITLPFDIIDPRGMMPRSTPPATTGEG